MRQYGDDFPRADVVLFEPDRADAEMFFTNIFSYSSRRRMCEHAYQKTRSDIWKRRHQLQPLLSPHGVTLNLDVLRDRSRSLVTGAESSVQPRLVKLGGVVSHLSESLSDLERYLRHAEAKAPKT